MEKSENLEKLENMEKPENLEKSENLEKPGDVLNSEFESEVRFLESSKKVSLFWPRRRKA